MIYSQKPLAEEGGIKVFSEEDFYWHTNISRTKIVELQKALEDLPLEESARKLGIDPKYVSAYQRSDFIYFLPCKNHEDFRVLDLGSGFGNITIPLAKKIPKSKIYAADASLDILKVLAAQAKWENCSNVECVKVDVLENKNLPFEKGSFDLILMNGVLEWVGAGTATGSPREHQVSVMRYLKTLLKDEGSLYVGIEGRFFPGYFKNVRDPHSGLLYTSVLPRFVANWLAKRSGLEAGYRTYTYSHRGYQKLFSESGFSVTNVETIYPVASYKDPFYLFSYSDEVAYRLAFGKLRNRIFPTARSSRLYRALRILRLEKLFAPSYLFIAKNGSSSRYRLLDDYLRRHSIGVKEFEPIKVLGSLYNSGATSFFLVSKTKKNLAYVLKIKRSGDFSSEMTKDEAANLESRGAVFPQSRQGDSEVFFYHEHRNDSSELAVRDAARAIKAIHLSTTTGSRKVGKIELSEGMIHGDFTIENVLLTDSGLKIIDWNDWARKELQVFDVCFLLLHYFAVAKKMSKVDLPAALLGGVSQAIFSEYDARINKEALPLLWIEFFRYYVRYSEKSHNLSKRDHYSDLANLFEGKLKEIGKD